MREVVVTLLFLLLVSIFLPCLLVNAKVSTIPHEDPALAQSMIDSFSFFIRYAEVFTLISSRQYEDASQLSERLSRITVPAELSSIITRYNDLTQQLIEQLNDLEETLDNASGLLGQYRLEEARQALDQAGVGVVKTQILLENLKDVTVTVGQRLGVLAVPAESEVRESYAELQRMIERLNDLVDQYYKLLERINQQFEELESQNLRKTALTLTLSVSECIVGEYVSASGILISNLMPLGNRVVTLYLDDVESAKVITRADGQYHTSVRIPYKYVSSVTVKAVYSPVGSDRGVYLGSSSPSLEIEVLYYKTLIDVSVPTIGYPGLPLVIKGNVASFEEDASLDGRQVKVFLGGILVSEQITDAIGTFTVQSIISSGVELGTHILKVTVDPKGVYGGASVHHNLTVQKMDTYVELTAPSFITLPSVVEINGTVSSASGPLGGVNVTVKFANLEAAINTLHDGRFSLTVDVPFNSVFAGYQNVQVIVQPSEPWQTSVEKNVSVFVLNVVSIAFTLIASFSVLSIMYFRFVKDRGKKDTQTSALAISKEVQREGDVTPVFAVSRGRFEALKGKVLKEYVEALLVVESSTGVRLLSNMTLREYLKTTGPKLGRVAEVFSELTVLAERSLYSPYKPTDEDSARAESLASRIRRSLTDAAN